MVNNFKTICIWSVRVVMFLCSCGENVASKLFLFSSIYRHKLVPSAFICSNPGITILPRPHLGTQTCFAAYRGIISRVFFLVQSRPNTIANQQRIVIWHYEGRWNATCHDLSCLEAGHRPLWRFVRFDKICPCPTSRSHLFLRLFDKMYRACNADQSKDDCFFVELFEKF